MCAGGGGGGGSTKVQTLRVVVRLTSEVVRKDITDTSAKNVFQQEVS